MPPIRPKVPIEFVPYIYSRAEIRSLLQAALGLRLNRNHTMDGRTVRTILLLLYATGARLREVLELEESDVNIPEARLVVRDSKLSRVRVIPIGRDLSKALVAYLKWKRRQGVAGPRLFVRIDGGPIKPDTFFGNFEKLLVLADVIRRDGAPYRPRLYDLRSTFAVHRITSWIRKRADLGRMLPALAAYMGLKDLSGTERFMALTPERFRNELNKLSPGQGSAWSHDNALMKYVEGL